MGVLFEQVGFDGRVCKIRKGLWSHTDWSGFQSLGLDDGLSCTSTRLL